MISLVFVCFLFSSSDSSFLGVSVSDSLGLTIASRGTLKKNPSAGAHATALIQAAAKFSFDGENPVVEILTDKSQTLISQSEGYTTAIQRKRTATQQTQEENKA